MGKIFYRFIGVARLMNYNDYYWADSDIIKISIEYDQLTLLIKNEKLLRIECNGVIGVTNLSMWDDTHIFNSFVSKISKNNDCEFLKQIYNMYGENYSPKPIKSDIFDLTIELSSFLVFHIFCYDVIVTEE